MIFFTSEKYFRIYQYNIWCRSSGIMKLGKAIYIEVAKPTLTILCCTLSSCTQSIAALLEMFLKFEFSTRKLREECFISSTTGICSTIIRQLFFKKKGNPRWKKRLKLCDLQPASFCFPSTGKYNHFLQKMNHC